MGQVIDSGLVGSTDFHSSHPQGHEGSERGAARAEDAQGSPTQSHISPIILVYEGKPGVYNTPRDTKRKHPDTHS